MDPLFELASEHGILTSYRDVDDRLCVATPESLLPVLRALGVDIDRPEQATDRLRARRDETARRLAEPVAVVWQGGISEVAVRLPATGCSGHVRVALRLESGEEQSWTQSTDHLR